MRNLLPLRRDRCLDLTLPAGITRLVSRDLDGVMPVDFDAVRRNAAKQGLSLSEVSIFYEGLTEEEIASLDACGLIVSRTPKVLVAKFAPDGSVMFPEKSVAVYSLSS